LSAECRLPAEQRWEVFSERGQSLQRRRSHVRALEAGTVYAVTAWHPKLECLLGGAVKPRRPGVGRVAAGL